MERRGRKKWQECVEGNVISIKEICCGLPQVIAFLYQRLLPFLFLYVCFMCWKRIDLWIWVEMRWNMI